jgi:RHS repeat-associated protein
VRVIILNERSAAFGSGWSLAGLQRLRFRGDSVLVVEGDGSAVFFAKSGAAWTRPEGEFSTFSFDGTYYRRRYPDGTQAVFYADGRLYYLRDRFDHQTTYEYTNGVLSGIVDPTGQRTVFEYHSGYTTPSLLARIRDPGGRVWSVWYNGSDVSQVVAPDGVVEWTGTYAAGHLLRTRMDRNGATFRFAHDAAGLVAADTLPAVPINGGAPQSPVLRARSWAASVLAPAGTGTSAVPAPRRVPSAIRAAAFGATGDSTRMSFDRYGRLLRAEGPVGDTSVVERNAHGQPTRIVDAAGTVKVYSWTGPNMTMSNDEETDVITTLVYDTLYNLPTRVSVGGATVEYAYGTRGELLTERVRTDSTIHRYDALYRLSWSQDAEGHRTDYAYHATGSQNTASVTERNPDGTTRTKSYGYDAFGRGTSVTDAGSVSRYAWFDLLNRDTAVVNGRGGRTRLGWQGTFLRTVTDPAGKVHTVNRNVLGWVESTVDPNGRTTAYRYDVNGNLSGKTNRRGQAIAYVHDGVGRLLTMTADNVTTTYGHGTPKNPWVSAGNPESTDTLEFDRRGRPHSHRAYLAGQRYTVLQSYLKEGPRDRVIVQTTGVGGSSIPYIYDNALRLTQITDPVGRWTRLAYNADGLPDTVSYMSGAKETLTYTPTHMPRQVKWSNGAHNVTYDYDQLDRVVERKGVGTVPLPGDSSRSFHYDNDGQLQGWADYRTTREYICEDPFDLSSCGYVTMTNLVRDKAYSYDAAGNRTDGATLQPSSNRYATFGGYTLEYDLDGNLTRKYNTTAGFDQRYGWNSLGQLTSVTTNGSTVYYGYNGFGQRVRRTDGAGVVTRFVYDGEDLMLEVDGAGNALRQYTYWPGVDMPHSVQVWAGGQNGKIFYYASDHPGSVMALFNDSASARVVNGYRYGPWGETVLANEAVPQPLRYMGRELDAATGLYYVRNRWYDVHQARFISEDPLGLAGGINLYAYAENSPTNLRDPYGLDPCDQKGELIEATTENGEPCELEGIVATAKPRRRGPNSGSSSNPSGRGPSGPIGSPVGPGGGGGGRGPGGNAPQQQCNPIINEPEVRRALDDIFNRSVATTPPREHGTWFIPTTLQGTGVSGPYLSVPEPTGSQASMPNTPRPTGATWNGHAHPNIGGGWQQSISVPQDTVWGHNNGVGVITVARDSISTWRSGEQPVTCPR